MSDRCYRIYDVTAGAPFGGWIEPVKAVDPSAVFGAAFDKMVDGYMREAQPEGERTIVCTYANMVQMRKARLVNAPRVEQEIVR